MRDTLPDWSLRPLVQALQAMRGVQLIAAMTLVAELQDFLRFDNAAQADGLCGPGAGRALLGPQASPGQHHQGRQLALRGACWWRSPGTTSTARA